MGGFFSPSVESVMPQTQQVDPNVPGMQPGQQQVATFLQEMFAGNMGNFFPTSDLQRQSTDAVSAFLSQDPQSTVMGMLQPGLMDIFGGGTFEGIGQAALPVMQRQLQQSLGGLASGAPGRFGTTFEAQGIDLASRAAQDFALLEAQARQQDVQNQLGAAGLMGSLGQQQFNQLMQAGQLGLQQTQQQVDPMLQMLLGGMQFLRPQPMQTITGDTIVGESPAGNLGQVLSFLPFIG